MTQVKNHRRRSSGEVSQAASLQRRWCFRFRRLGKWVVGSLAQKIKLFKMFKSQWKNTKTRL